MGACYDPRPMENVDLHCHSRASDGLLAPADIVLRAQGLGVMTLALTDHDVTSGLEEATEAAHEARTRFVPGVEISVTWNGTTIHVVGLGIDPGDPSLAEGLKRVRGGRTRRAARIAEPGDVVLLSPACASFDQFRDFEARGDAFAAAVAALG